MAKSENEPLVNSAEETAGMTAEEEKNVSENTEETTEAETAASPETEVQGEDDMISPEDSMIIPEPEVAKEALTSEEYALFQQMMQKMAFYNPHKFAAATRAQTKEMFASEHIVTEDGDTKVENESTMLKQDMLELVASAKAKRILSGFINGFREIETNGSVKQYIADVSYGNGTCKVMIPDYVLFHFPYEEHLTQKTQQAVQNRIRRMIGAEVKFIVKYFDQKTKTAYADRLKAMENISWNNYIRETSDGTPRVCVGMIVQARVIAVAGNYIIVNALGSDSKIMREECSWNYINDCREAFKVNDILNCKVLAIKENVVEKASKEQYRLIATTLSVKQTTENPVKKYFNDFAIDGLYRATVTYINTDGVFVILNDRVPCLTAYPRYGQLPEIGDQRVIKITEKIKDEEKGDYRIFGVLQAQ